VVRIHAGKRKQETAFPMKSGFLFLSDAVLAWATKNKIPLLTVGWKFG
jgi:hypothetical protein